MIKKDMTGYAVVSALLVILAVVFAFYGLSQRDTPPVILPSDTGQGPGMSGEDGIVVIKIDRDTVQDAIRSLKRPESYTAAFTVETFWEQGNSHQTVDVWVSGETQKIEIQGGPESRRKHILLTQSKVYIWYAEDAAWYEEELGGLVGTGRRVRDELQKIPTYEDVLEFDAERILDAGYENFNDEYCIFCVVRAGTEREITEKYWISVKSGLLVGCETFDEGELAIKIYGSIFINEPEENVFALPSGDIVG